jgi:adenosylcobinamide-GDP ribazoletransferase
MKPEAAQPTNKAAMTNEVRRLLAAIQYFTRLPVPAWVGHDQTVLEDAARYFPAVGLIVGAAGAAVLLAAGRLWPMPAALVLSVIATVLVSGAFHEDGLADAIDGLGGGLDRSRSLEIMKDSRIGVFGAAALMSVLLLKVATLSAVPIRTAALALIAGNTVSRLGGVLIMVTLPYVRELGDSRSKPLVQSISVISILIGCATAALALYPLQLRGVAGALAVFGVCLLWRGYIEHRLGGYTGDCLGAAQQFGECVFYLACTATW